MRIGIKMSISIGTATGEKKFPGNLIYLACADSLLQAIEIGHFHRADYDTIRDFIELIDRAEYVKKNLERKVIGQDACSDFSLLTDTLYRMGQDWDYLDSIKKNLEGMACKVTEASAETINFLESLLSLYLDEGRC